MKTKSANIEKKRDSVLSMTTIGVGMVGAAILSIIAAETSLFDKVSQLIL